MQNKFVTEIEKKRRTSAETQFAKPDSRREGAVHNTWNSSSPAMPPSVVPSPVDTKTKAASLWADASDDDSEELYSLGKGENTAEMEPPGGSGFDITKIDGDSLQGKNENISPLDAVCNADSLRAGMVGCGLHGELSVHERVAQELKNNYS